jgi:hypothetical protein
MLAAAVKRIIYADLALFQLNYFSHKTSGKGEE